MSCMLQNSALTLVSNLRIWDIKNLSTENLYTRIIYILASFLYISITVGSVDLVSFFCGRQAKRLYFPSSYYCWRSMMTIQNMFKKTEVRTSLCWIIKNSQYKYDLNFLFYYNMHCLFWLQSSDRALNLIRPCILKLVVSWLYTWDLKGNGLKNLWWSVLPQHNGIFWVSGNTVESISKWSVCLRIQFQ